MPIPKYGAKSQLGNWMAPEDMDNELNMRFPDCMKGGLYSQAHIRVFSVSYTCATCTQTDTHIHAYIHKCYTLPHVHSHVNTHSNMHIHRDTHSLACTHKLTDTHTHIHTVDQIPLRVHCRPHHVRHPLQHGTSGVTAVQDRHPADRLGLRGGQHAHHDADGCQRPAGPGGWGLRQVSALRRQTTAPDWSVQDHLLCV